MRSCYACGAALEDSLQVHRATVCPACSADLRVCRNCTFYAPGRHWDCSETVPECVVDKERANFCEYFRFRPGPPRQGVSTAKRDEARQKLDKLFGS
jgi:hypothetical protein